MDVKVIADLLHEAAETHHRVYRIVDGEDPDERPPGRQGTRGRRGLVGGSRAGGPCLR